MLNEWPEMRCHFERSEESRPGLSVAICPTQSKIPRFALSKVCHSERSEESELVRFGLTFHGSWGESTFSGGAGASPSATAYCALLGTDLPICPPAFCVLPTAFPQSLSSLAP